MGLDQHGFHGDFSERNRLLELEAKQDYRSTLERLNTFQQFDE